MRCLCRLSEPSPRFYLSSMAKAYINGTEARDDNSLFRRNDRTEIKNPFQAFSLFLALANLL